LPPRQPPKIRRNVIDNTTIEKQIRLHAENPRGLLSTPDELLSLLGSLGAYKPNGGEGDRALMLRLFEGKPIILDRVSAGSIRADVGLMGIIAGTQPEKIAKLAPNFSTDGLLQRFLFVMDDGVEREGLDEAPDVMALRDYASLIQSLARAEYVMADPIRLTPEAYAILKPALREINNLKHLPNSSA
jgi:hypothetical protein